MPTLHVSPLSRLEETVALTRARHLVTLINLGTPVRRPQGIEPDRHLLLGLSDISRPLDGHVLAGEGDVARLLAFLRGWDRAAPMVIHCWAGISRSTAAAYIAACALEPARDEEEAAKALRAAAPSATPNARLVALADAALGRHGRMIRAIAGIGRGADAFEGTPFAMPLA
ncbi:protein tyrosine phosphatase [Bosea sp. (in: a-proteobacteria)]|uniref:tyrosine phosphatase family protein n=1 Tax=Bosea sp. (in: a-proteobacteria) TaxID=1871050 RepID=UPI0026300730|nr:protein tyrosine phosphatase [Bosea sp. (in: a-proteobacteria)]MCO5092460.1 protein tyrosine phosphatase [Bosea sp. (in: a-proteobacteria)]